MVLLVVDTQNLVVNKELYKYDTFIHHIKTLIKESRDHHVEVIYVVHDDGAGNELTKGNKGYEIIDEFKPMLNEVIFDKKYNSAFKDTGLIEYLHNKKEKDIILVGLKTDYCLDASVKAGFEHGFKIFIPEYTNSTNDNEFMSGEESYKYYNELMWNNRYAKCISFEETLQLIRE